MIQDIIDKVIGYFEFQKECFGTDLLVELPEISINDIQNIHENRIETMPKPQLIKSEIPKVANLPVLSSISADWADSKTMDELYSKIHDCQQCELGITRNKFVYGSGNPNADIMVIGEAPGADEDEQGLPFVGRAGQLLTKILESINLSRDEVYIANIVKCRPPNNRRPELNEVDNCEPYLKKQIELIKPAFILSLGLTSVDTLLKKNHKMGEIRGKILDYYGIKMMVTYHPAALLRNPNWKKFVWEDVKNLKSLYEEYLKTK